VNIVVSFSEKVRDNVIFTDVTITSSLRIVLYFLSKMSLHDVSCQKLRNCVYMVYLIQMQIYLNSYLLNMRKKLSEKLRQNIVQTYSQICDS